MIVETDLIYATAQRPLLWDIYRPDDSSAGTPVVVVLHGGGWRTGSRREMADACAAFVQRGYTAIAPEYRLLPEVSWPEPLRDVERCVAAIIEQAKHLGIDPRHIFLAGFSAGAHLCLLAAAGQTAVTAVAAFFPLVRIGPREAAMLDLAHQDEWAASSPIEHINALPPTTVFASDLDQISPWETAFEFCRAARTAGRVAELQLFADLPHEFVRLPGMMDQTVAASTAFFTRTALNKASFDTANQKLHAWWHEMLSALPAPDVEAKKSHLHLP